MKKSGFNQTAYRIIKLLEWLNHQPLSLEQINQRFLDDPMISKSLSQDTIGLYMNTLRAIGCEIDRPKPSNQFCYTLISHPFSYVLKEEEIQFLFQLAQCIDESVTYQDVLGRLRLILNLIDHASNPNRQDIRDRFFEVTRLKDLDQLEQMIDSLEYYCSKPVVLEVVYTSPPNRKNTRQLLPEKLLYWNDSIYLQAYMSEYEGCVLLRVDRMEQIKEITNSDILENLTLKRLQQEEIWIRFINCNLDDLPLMNYVNVTDYCTDPFDEKHLLVKFQTSNLFFLKQALLESGQLFQVISPQSFQQDLRAFLQETQGLYTA